LKLKIAAVACAGTGVVCGVPVQHMREDTMTELLDLREKGLCGPVAMLISYLIPSMGGLTALDLSSNSLEDEGISAVCEAIKSNKETKLASLNFMDNGIGPVGANTVAAMVAVTGALTKIDVSRNFLGPEGAKVFADALRVNGSLTKMSLAETKLGEEGTKAICEALEQNKTFKELDLSGGYPSFNNIGGAAGAKHVAKMLGVNGALTQVLVFRSPWIHLLCSLTLALL
jgi:hypothetical protein